MLGHRDSITYVWLDQKRGQQPMQAGSNVAIVTIVTGAPFDFPRGRHTRLAELLLG